MQYNLIVTLDAENDIAQALEYLEEEQTELATKLLDDLDEAMARITESPLQFQIKYRNVRIKFTKIFQYGVHYIVDNHDIYVMAVMHTSREPRT